MDNLFVRKCFNTSSNIFHKDACILLGFVDNLKRSLLSDTKCPSVVQLRHLKKLLGVPLFVVLKP